MTFRQMLCAVCLLAAACVTPPAGAPPRSTEGWTEWRSPHFTLRTDLSNSDANKAIHYLEDARTALIAVAWSGAHFPDERIEVIVLADEMEFARLFTQDVGALTQMYGFPPRMILEGRPDRWEQRGSLEIEGRSSTLKHEMTHHLASYIYARQPRWFAEGLAQFLETVQVSADGRTALIGSANLKAVAEYKRHRTVTARDALAWGGKLDTFDASKTEGLYGLSWLLVHWLVNTHPKEFTAYQQQLAQGATPSEAWSRALFGIPVDGLDDALNHYILSGNYSQATLTLPLESPSIESRPLPPARVHMIRATLAATASSATALYSREHANEAARERHQALEIDPLDVEALVSTPPEQTPEKCRQATQAHPDDATAWRLLGQSLLAAQAPWPQCQAALRKAMILDSADPQAPNALARAYLKLGQPANALPLAEKALRLAPWSVDMLLTYAASLAGTGQCAPAAIAGARALDLLPENAGPAVRQQLEEQLAQLNARCSPT